MKAANLVMQALNGTAISTSGAAAVALKDVADELAHRVALHGEQEALNTIDVYTVERRIYCKVNAANAKEPSAKRSLTQAVSGYDVALAILRV